MHIKDYFAEIKNKNFLFCGFEVYKNLVSN